MPQELIVASMAAEIAKKKTTDAEITLLKQLDRADVSIEVVIPDDISAQSFKTALSAVCKTFVKANWQAETLFPVLGRLMLVAQEHEELWSSQFDKYEDFVGFLETEYGVGRSTCFEARKRVDRWGGVLSLEEFKAVGRVNLGDISKVVPKGDEKKGTSKKLLEIAKTGTNKALREYIAEKLHVSASEQIGAVLRIPCNKRQERDFTRFFADPDIQAYCGTDKAAEILDHILEEIRQEWKDEGAAKRAQQDPEEETAQAV